MTGGVNLTESTSSILSVCFQNGALEFPFIPSNYLLHGLKKKLLVPALKKSGVKCALSSNCFIILCVFSSNLTYYLEISRFECASAYE